MDEVAELLGKVEPTKRRRDAETLLVLMRESTGEKPTLHPGNIVGFGTYHYRYASGHEGDAPAAAFAPRKAATTIYLMDGVGAYEAELAALGPHTTGAGCLYVKDLEICDLDVLRRIVRSSYRALTSGVYGQRAREGGG